MSHDMPTTEQEHDVGLHAGARRLFCDRCSAEAAVEEHAKVLALAVAAEREALRAQVATLTAERDGAVAEVAALRRERDVARAAVEVERAECLDLAVDAMSPFSGTDNDAHNEACRRIIDGIKRRGAR